MGISTRGSAKKQSNVSTGFSFSKGKTTDTTDYQELAKTSSVIAKKLALSGEIKDQISARINSSPPEFSLKDIRAAIPEHCFHRSFLISTLYLLADCAIIGAGIWCTTQFDTWFTEETVGAYASFAKAAGWVLYWLVAGHVGTGIWVIGHECGHHGYTGIEWLNDVMGFFIHSAVLVPFFSWQISHRKHHSNTGNLDRDEVHVPPIWSEEPSKRDLKKLKEHPEDHHLEYFALFTSGVLKRVRNVVIMLLLGWPIYLLTNETSHKNYPKNKFVNHFLPSSPIYLPKEGKLIVLSDMGVMGAIYALFHLGTVFGHSQIAMLYVVPYLIVNLYLVFITYLQHTDERLVHYDNTEWEWLRGALCTIDRDYGWLLNIVFHHIGDTHVTHHLFSYLPHYHAQEATKAVKKVVGDYYKFDDTNVWKVMWRLHSNSPFVMRECDGEKFIEGSEKRQHAYWYYPHAAYVRQKVVKNK